MRELEGAAKATRESTAERALLLQRRVDALADEKRVLETKLSQAELESAQLKSQLARAGSDIERVSRPAHAELDASIRRLEDEVLLLLDGINNGILYSNCIN